MMSSNLTTAENGGIEQAQSNWWLARWSTQLACSGAIILLFCGAFTALFNLLPTPSIACCVGGCIQILTAGLVLAIEGSSFVSFLRFAKPVGLFFVDKTVWLKTAVYASFTILSMLVGCHSFFLVLGFLISACITALFAMLLIGKKANIDDMRQSAWQPPSQ